MPRRPRFFVEGGIYHVYNRFARGAEIFAEPEEAIEFIEILRKARDRDSLRIYAWTLMTLPSMCSPATANFLARSSIR